MTEGEDRQGAEGSGTPGSTQEAERPTCRGFRQYWPFRSRRSGPLVPPGPLAVLIATRSQSSLH
jgi:hypothetical protein